MGWKDWIKPWWPGQHKKHHHKAKKHAPGKKIGHGKDKGKGTESYMIPQGKKYLRLQRFETMSPAQKRIIKKMAKPVRTKEFKEPKGFKIGQKFLNKAMKEGPKRSALERKGEKFLEKGIEKGLKPTDIEKRGAKFLEKGLKHELPVSPTETQGQNFLQNLLGRTPEQQLEGFEAPYLRQFREQTVPEIAERFTGQDAQRSSAFGQTMGQAGAALQENLAALKGNLVNQLLGQQLQGANVGLGYAQMPQQRYQLQQQNANLGLSYGQMPQQRYQLQQQNANLGLGYAQLPGQRFGQQLQATQAGMQSSLIPQQMQEDLYRFAKNREFQERQQVLGHQPWGMLSVPPKGRQPGFWQGMAGPGIGALAGAGIGGLIGGPAGALAGAGIGASVGGAHVPNIQMPQGASPMQVGATSQRMMGPIQNNL